MTSPRRPRAQNVVPTDPRAAEWMRRHLRDAKSRLTAIRTHRQGRLAKAQAQVDHQTRKIAALNARLEQVAQAAKVLDQGWDAWQPDRNAKPYRATPLPLGALSKGALTVLRKAGRPMRSKEIASAIFILHGFPLPAAATLGVIAGQITTNLAKKEHDIVRRERHRSGDVWSIIPLSEIRAKT